MKRFSVITIGLYLIALFSLIFIFSVESSDKIKNTEANDVILTIRDYWPDVDSAINALKKYEIDYIILGEGQNIIGESRQGLKTDYQHDFIHKDYSVEILKNGKIQGKIIFINHEDEELKSKIKIGLLVFFFLFLLKDMFIILGLRKYIFMPVQRMNAFARQIAKGYLDIPVRNMERDSFGAFSESFDLMREELIYAKKREREADKLRREMIASISHDLKNPLASIQAVAEYQYLTNDSEELRQEFQTIAQKTNQIRGMIVNLHSSMLNDLERLEVNIEVGESSVIEKALRQADYKKRIKDFCIQECLIMIDKVRIAQVMDNIISNSYKYADTEIEIKSYFKDNYLCVIIKDYGQGVKKEEEIFLTQKYFRGQNAKEKEGSGLGIYIAEYLIKSMKGKLLCCSKEGEWFEVRLCFALAA